MARRKSGNTKTGMPGGKPGSPPPEPSTMADRFNLMDFTDKLILDLEMLRAGKISIREAKARADLAKQVLRGVHYIVTAQRFIEGQALRIEAPKEDD